SVPLSLRPSVPSSFLCLHCGYDLRGLTGDPLTCPECGQDTPVFGYELAWQETMRRRRLRMVGASDIAMGSALAASVGLVLLGNDPLLGSALLIGGVIVCALALRDFHRRARHESNRVVALMGCCGATIGAMITGCILSGLAMITLGLCIAVAVYITQRTLGIESLEYAGPAAMPLLAACGLAAAILITVCMRRALIREAGTPPWRAKHGENTASSKHGDT
ncbi:MAG: hypothetical protein JXO22_12850, partial [Phycisphaerae bacterium]|nr:hypothetical protein [Phycisphaerae bacterium]